MKSTSIFLAIAGLAIASPVYNAAAGSAYAAEKSVQAVQTSGASAEEDKA